MIRVERVKKFEGYRVVKIFKRIPPIGYGGYIVLFVCVSICLKACICEKGQSFLNRATDHGQNIWGTTTPCM